jgi:outer membrane protein assembly factor BamD
MSILFRPTQLLALTALFLAACSSSNPYQGMDEQQMYAYARQKFEDHDWDRTIQTLDRFFASYGGSTLSDSARMLQADAYFGKGDYLTARSEYQRFLDRFPGSDQAPVAALGMCRALVELSPIPQRDQEYTQEAIVACRNVVADYAGTEQAQQAGKMVNDMRVKLAEKEYLNAEFYFRRDLYDSAIKYFDFVAQLYPETEYAPKALKGIYDSNKAIGYDDLAEDARKKLLEQYPDSPEAASLRTDDGSS